MTTTATRPAAQAAADAQAAALYQRAHADPPPCLIRDCPVCAEQPPPCWQCLDGRPCVCKGEGPNHERG